MAFEDTGHDAETIALLREVLEAAWQEVEGRMTLPANKARHRLAEAILTVFADGERDKIRLKNLALLRSGLR